MPHGAHASLYLAGIGDSAQGGGCHVAVLEGRNEISALRRIVAEPMQELREAPLGRVHSAAPLNGLESFAVRRFGDLRGFTLCAVITPKIVLIQWSEIPADGDHRGARGIDGERLHLIARDAGFLDCLA